MANSKNTKNTNAKASISNEEAMAHVSALIAKAKRDGTIQASELTAELEKLDLPVENIEQIYDTFDALGIQIVGAELELDPELIHACMSHGWGITVDVKPEQTMEKVLYATDELTGLIGAAAQMRPSRSVDDMELKSLKKKYKANGFAAGCSREVIGRGAELLGWELDELLTRTLDAMKSLPEELRTF